MPMTGVGAFLCSLASGDTLPAGAFQMLTNDEFLPILCDLLISYLFCELPVVERPFAAAKVCWSPEAPD
jgi:hypothetical protein